MTELLALALKLKEVNKKASNIDEKVETLAINQKTTINDKMVALYEQNKAEIKDFIENIPIPKDGKDFDTNLWLQKDKKIDTTVNSAVLKIQEQTQAKINALDKKVADYEAQVQKITAEADALIQFFNNNPHLFKGEDGIDGVDGKDGIDGKDGQNGVNGKDGKNGKDGIGIKDIAEKNGDIIITLTDGTIKKLKMPRDIRVVTGGGGAKGGGVSYYTNLNPVPNKVGGINAGTTFDNIAITKVLDMLLYPFEITLSINPTQAQFGQVINSIMLQFNTNGAENANIDGIDVTGLSDLIYTEGVTSDKTFTLTAEKDKQIKTKTASIKFLNNIYWGATPNPSPTNTEILASSKQLSNSKNRKVIYNCSGGQRYFIAYPKRLGNITLTVNGFPNNNFTQIERSFENEFGYIEDYFICYGNTIVFGSDIPATWS